MKSRKIADVYEGEHRTFYNYYKGNQRITLGMPTSPRAKDVWVSVNGETKDKISVGQARRLMSSSGSGSLAIGSGGSGTCNSCGKTLRGNKNKPLCYSCWSDS